MKHRVSNPLLPHLLILAAGSSLFAISSASAASGTWNVDANGLWSNAGNWTPGIADGSGFTANFTNNITADRTVSLDSDRTLSTVVFGDSDTSSAGSWILNNNGTSTNNLILGTTPTITVNALGTNKDATISAIIQGSAGFTKNGAGTLVLSGNNSVLTGNLSITGGTLSVGANNNLGLVSGGTGGGWILMNGGTLRATGSFIMNAANTTTDANNLRRVNISGNSTIEVTGSNNLGIGSTGSYTGTSPLYGSGTLNKTGSGTLTLRTNATIANSFSGTTNVNAGTLNLQTQGALSNSSTINVASGAVLNVASVSGGWTLGSTQTLAGSGTITGSATVGGNLNPGTSPGILSFTNSLALASTSTTTFEIDGAVRGTGYDGVNVGSTLGLDGSLVFDIGTIFSEGSYTFDLFSVTGATSGNFDAVSFSGAMGSGSLGFNAGIWSLVDGDNTWTFTQSTGDLNLTVIPEPRAALLGGLGMLMLLRRRRA